MPFLKNFAEIVRENVPLAPLTTFGIGGPARFVVEPRTVDELAGVLGGLDEEGIERRMLGGGSNILISDEGFPGAVIRLKGELADLTFNGERITAGAGAALARLVRECSERALSGAEGLVGIPGTLGGALVANAGGRWGSLGDIVDSVSLLSPEYDVRTLASADISFGYRRSSLCGEAVVGAVFRLKSGERAAISRATADFLERKKKTQDLAAKSAGCVFRNPATGLSAGELIEKAGLKGKASGGARVSSVHANFIINTGSATAADVRDLIDRVRSGVKNECEVDLGLEIELW